MEKLQLNKAETNDSAREKNRISRFKEAWETVLNIIWPRTCLSCGDKLSAAGIKDTLCVSCFKKILPNLPPFCHHCGRQLKRPFLTKHICARCARKPLYFDRALSPLRYEGPVKELLHQFKYSQKDYLGKPLSDFIISFLREYNFPVDYMDMLIPIPLHEAKLREREFNQAYILSAHVAAAFNKEVCGTALIRRRATRTQTDLKPEERFTNVENCFAVTDSAKIKSKNILLVDDVLTTGATASEAARTLKEAGARIVFALTLAN